MEETITQQAIRLKKEKVIKGITCPSCNGELDITDGIRSLNCKFCGTLLVAKGMGGSMRFYVQRKVKREEAINNAMKWLGSGLSKAKGLKTNSKISETFLTYIPYWRISADVVGWIFGQEKRTRTSDGRTETYYVDVEKKIMQSFDRTYSACDVSELGVKQVNLAGDELHPVEMETLQKDGMLFNVVSSENEAYDYALEQFAGEARASADVDNITFEHTDLVRKQISIVYYPLWVIRYTFANRTYQVVVDGDKGTICYGKAPGNNLYRAIIGILGTAAGMFLCTFFGAFQLIGRSNGSAKFAIGLYVISVIFGILLIRKGYKRFRYGGEVEEGTGIVVQGQGKSGSGGVSSDIKNEAVEFTKNAAVSAAFGAIAGSLFNRD
jgi:hypothetical protein